jgi:3-hydroxymyristoyl/3-hydroxydecanoyl-(acyl carrier protein) dehydratase
MNFLFVDRILELKEGKSAKGLKHITADDPYLKTNSKGQLVLSSCIIGEALGQLTAWNVMKVNHFSLRPVAGIVNEVQFYREAFLGETVILNTEIERLDEQVVVYNSYASICEEKIFSIGHSMGPLLSMEDFIAPEEAQRQFEMINRPGEYDASSRVLQDSLSVCPSTHCSFFDHILELQPKGILAEKKISLLAPYFVDHFPRKPVLPLTLLLEGQLELADYFLQKELGEGEAFKGFKPAALVKVKMKQFVMPGDRLISSLKIKEQTDEKIVFECKSMVEDKKVCSAEMIFKPCKKT